MTPPDSAAARTTSDTPSKRVPLILAATFFMLLLDGSILNTSLPSMARALQVQALDLSSVVTVYLLAGAAVLPLTQWLGDRFGLRRLFLVAVALFTIASLGCGVAQTPTQLVIARTLQGLGGGVMFPVGRTIAMQGARQEDVIGITALLTWPALFAPVIGPPLGGWITETFSWRWNFLLNLPLGLLGLVLIRRWLGRDTPTTARPLDRTGAFGGALGLMLLLGGLEWTAHAVGEHHHLWPALACVGAGLAALLYTWRHLQRTPTPVVSLAPLRHTSFALTATAGMVAAMCQHAMPFLLPLLFQLGLGMNAVAAGAMLLPYFLGNLGAKSVTTPLLKTFGFRRLALAATAASGACIACFAAVEQATPHLVLIGLLLCAGASRSVLMTVLNTLTFADITPAERSAASTLSTVWMQTAAALAVAFGALCLAVAQMTHGGLAPSTIDFRITFAVLGLVCVSTLLGLRRLHPNTGAALTQHTR